MRLPPCNWRAKVSSFNRLYFLYFLCDGNCTSVNFYVILNACETLEKTELVALPAKNVLHPSGIVLHGAVCVQVCNFTNSFSDGRLLCYLIHHYHPSLLPLHLITNYTTLSEVRYSGTRNFPPFGMWQWLNLETLFKQHSLQVILCIAYKLLLLSRFLLLTFLLPQ